MAHLIPGNLDDSFKPVSLRGTPALTIQKREASFLVGKARSHEADMAIVLGDMNGSSLSDLSQAGWNLLDGNVLDQIWGSPRIGTTFSHIEVPNTITQKISDHLPVVVEITLAQ